MKFINQMEPYFDDKEKNALMEYISSGGWGTEFKQTRFLEDMIADYTGAKYCWMMPNGTLSLSCALVALGVKTGDEVIVPDYTMAATANAVCLIGAKPVFVDINRNNLCMDLSDMKSKVTPKTKAVMLVSINGRYPDNIESFLDFCNEKNIGLIEDAAQSLGSFHKGKHIGTYGIIGSFSFSAPKVITTGQGGALITNDFEVSERIKKIRDFGREMGGADHYITMGWNLKFSDFQAVIGIEQMKKLPYRVQRKKEMGMLYEKLLNNIDAIELIKTNYEDTAPWFYDVLCSNREELMAYLKQCGIGSRPFYPPLHSEPVYNLDMSFPVTEEISRKGLWLPSSITLRDDDIQYICNCIRLFFEDNNQS